MNFALLLLFLCASSLQSEEYVNKEITIYDYKLDRPGQSLYFDYQQIDNSEITSDLYKELNVSANLLMTKTNSFGGVQNLYLRGVNADQIQITYDGAVLNDPSNVSRGFNFSELSTYSISAADIFYGPHNNTQGTYANAGAINFKSLTVDQPTLILKSGSYESNGITFLLPVEKIRQQWEWQTFKSRGMSSFIDGQEHDGLIDQRLKVNGVVSLPKNYEANYFVMYRSRSEDLDFGGGTDPDDQNYTSKDRMILPFLKIQGKYNNCIDHFISMQKTFRKRATDNAQDSNNSTPSFFLSHSELDIVKLSIEQNCYENFNSKIIIEHNKEQMSSKDQSSQITEMTKNEQKTDSFSYKQDYVLDADQKITMGAKIDLWEGKANLASYQAGYTFLILKKLVFSNNLSFGRKIPSLYQLYSNYGNANLEREKNWQYEIVMSQDTPRFNTELVSYFSQYQEMVDYDFLTEKYINSGRNEIYGIESRNNFKIHSSWGNKLNVNYLSAHNKITNEQLLLRPKWQGSNSLYFKEEKRSYEFQTQYIGERRATDPISFSSLKAKSIFLVHLLFGQEIASQTKCNFSIQNIFNKKYSTIPGYSALGLSVFGEITQEF